MKDLAPQTGARGLPGSLVRPAQGGCRRASDGQTDRRMRRQTRWKWEGRALTLVSGGSSCHELPRVSPSLRAAMASFENGCDGPLWTAVPRSVPQSCPTLCDPTDRSPPGSSSDHGDLPHTGTVSSSLAVGRYPVALSSWQVRKSPRLAGCCRMLPAIHHLAAPLSPQMGKLRPWGPPATFRQVSSEPPVQTEGGRGSVTSSWPPAGHRLDQRKDGDHLLGSPGPRSTPQE